LIKTFKSWVNEIEAGMRKRRIALGLEDPPEGEEAPKRARPVRKVVAGDHRDDEGGGHLSYKVGDLALELVPEADIAESTSQGQVDEALLAGHGARAVFEKPFMTCTVVRNIIVCWRDSQKAMHEHCPDSLHILLFLWYLFDSHRVRHLVVGHDPRLG
jgi:hypothetical protein